ncbi:MAG: 2,3-bisphosphoglycerate-independent phosphoglycerate mutase [Solirubrobacteraceae bacterium]|nr:2,3-bisphosphoglycerate-independent phosphoglycerate mutase [Solirubrobacteraceae bacterium]
MADHFPQVCLVVLDGWGLAPAGPGNAVELANTPVFDDLWARYPHTQLTACGAAVGLPDGQMGNSEVGHMNLGAGAVVKQDLTRINEAVANGALAANDTLRAAMTGADRVHLIGLVSDGGVHSSEEHLEALIGLGAELGVPDLVIHAFTDGRDASPTGGTQYLTDVQAWCARAGNARVASVIGRYFAMDRDSRWDRIQQAYDLLTRGEAPHHVDTAPEAAAAAYERGETDEFITATSVGAEGTIRPGDSVIAFNFRPDRMREITRALADPAFTEIDRHGVGVVSRYTTLTEYDESWSFPIAFPPARPEVTLPHVVAQAGGTQLHVAETEKYPHVTYFFAGGEEVPETGEERRMAPSPRDVATYDLKPEMSAFEAADKFVEAWNTAGGFRFAIINFANPDMVGHTGVIPAAVTAVEAADTNLGRVVEAVQATGGALIVTADHGNADEMLEDDGSPDTQHSLNPVPFIVTDAGAQLDHEGGVLADVAPTALALLGIEQPVEMTGRSLLT